MSEYAIEDEPTTLPEPMGEIQDDFEEDHPEDALTHRPMHVSGQRDTADTMSWFRQRNKNHVTTRSGLCLKTQHEARNIPAKYGTALAAQHATPAKDRYSLSHARRGMVGYSLGSNPAGHVFAFSHQDDADAWYIWTTDLFVAGLVSMARLSTLLTAWNMKFQFAAKSLNGVALRLPTQRVAPLRGKTPHINDAIHELQAAIKFHEEKGHTGLVNALKNDVAEIESTRKQYS